MTTGVYRRFISIVDIDDRKKLDGIWIEKALVVAVEPLRASHAELLAAAKKANVLIVPGASISTLATCKEILKAAIANAEKLVSEEEA